MKIDFNKDYTHGELHIGSGLYHREYKPGDGPFEVTPEEWVDANATGHFDTLPEEQAKPEPIASKPDGFKPTETSNVTPAFVSPVVLDKGA